MPIGLTESGSPRSSSTSE